MKVKEKEEAQEFVKQQENIVKAKHRDISIDLVRVVACLMVIATHVCLQVLNPCFNRIDWSRLLEKSFVTDGVPLFLMITGFFIANGRSYKKIWKSTIVKVLIPSIIYILFSQIFYMYIINKESITWCLKNSFNNLNMVGTLKCLVTGNTANINSLCQHLWYIFAYIKIIIWIPILWLVCKEEKTSKLARRIIIAFGILSSIVTDAQRFVILPKIGAMEVFELVDREILYVLFGYELFVHKDKLKNKKVFLLSTIGFFIINFVRYKIESKYMSINSFTDIVGRENFIDWRYTSLSIISGILLFTGVYAFEIKSKIFEKIILWLSDKTFGVYLIHYLILVKVDLYKFEKIEKFHLEMIYLILGTIATFIVSVLIVYVFKILKELIIKGIKLVGENK
jgi:surface polysaccharide O-acyltransferase-like enzyme